MKKRLVLGLLLVVTLMFASACYIPDPTANGGGAEVCNPC